MLEINTDFMRPLRLPIMPSDNRLSVDRRALGPRS